MERLAILGALVSASLRSEFQYRANAVTSILGGLIYGVVRLLGKSRAARTRSGQGPKA